MDVVSLSSSRTVGSIYRLVIIELHVSGIFIFPLIMTSYLME